MNIPTRCMNQFERFKSINTSRYRLIRVSIFVCRKARGVRMTELSTCTSSPGVEVTIGEDSYSMGFSACNFFHLKIL